MIAICGDFHGNFSDVNKFIARHNEISIIFQCGDFGFWPKLNGKTYVDEMSGKIKNYKTVKDLKNKNVQIFWCDGNHEDYDSIESLTNYEIVPNVFYMKRGSTIKLNDGRNILFIGGALSIDKKYRTPGLSWFPQETITQKDIYNLPDKKIDIVISHTAPLKFKLNDYHEEYKDPSRIALDYVLEKYNPKLWYFGHMHKFQTGTTDGCSWFGLSAINFGDRWWMYLEEKE